LLLWQLAFLLLFIFSAGPVFAQGDPPAAETKGTEMTVADAVLLAVRHNRTIESAYLDRVVQKFNLEVAEDKFVPNLDLDVSTDFAESTTRNGTQTRSGSENIDTTVAVTQVIPTGGTFVFTWDTALDKDKTDGDISSKSNTDTWQVTFQQPLLKGGGVDVNTASVKTARFQEQSNIMSLKSTMITTVTSVVGAYRSLTTVTSVVGAYRSFLQAKGQVDISKASLVRAKELLERNKLLISSGRMAAVEIVQVEADIANKEFAYQSTLNSMDNARLNLLKILDIDKHTQIVPVYEGEIKPIHPDLERCIDTALSNRPDYTQALINLEISNINLMLAQNNMLWELSLDSSLQYSGAEDRLTDAKTKGESWSAGLSLSIPLYGDLTRKQRLVGAQTNLKKTKLDIKELEDNIEIEVQDLVRDVESRLKQLRLATLARELSAQKLEIEQEKQKAGLSSNFQIVTFQNDLLNAQNSEIDAIISYRNALTALDQALGTTLDTWKIEFRKD